MVGEELAFLKRAKYRSGFLECDHPVNTIGAEDTELTFVVTTKVNKTTMTFAGTGQGHLVNGSDTLPVFVLQQDHRLAGHWSGQAKIGKLNHLAGDRLRRRGNW
jgi:hypothetical protein